MSRIIGLNIRRLHQLAIITEEMKTDFKHAIAHHSMAYMIWLVMQVNGRIVFMEEMDYYKLTGFTVGEVGEVELLTATCEHGSADIMAPVAAILIMDFGFAELQIMKKNKPKRTDQVHS